MDTLAQSLRLALRSLARQPVLTGVVILTLAVAIGANTAIYSVVEGVLLRPLPYPEEERLVTVQIGRRPLAGSAVTTGSLSNRGYQLLVADNRSFSKVGAYQEIQDEPATGALTGEGAPVPVTVGFLSPTAFEVLGVNPRLGRWPRAEEGVPDAPYVVVLSDHLWRQVFGADPAIVGRVITVVGFSYEVIGVMPPEFEFPEPGLDIWVPFVLDPASESNNNHYISAIARLAPGVTLESAKADNERLIGRYGELGYAGSWLQNSWDGTAHVRPLRDRIVGDARLPLLIALGAVGFVLLIACSNVANLLLARAESRARESAIQLALGSGRGRLIRQAMTESVLLAFAGAAAGVLLALLATRLLVAMGPASIPRLHEVGIRGSGLLVTTAIAIGSALLFGLLPSLRTSSEKSASLLRDGRRGSTDGRGQQRVRSALVVVQIALALVLTVGAGLMIRTFQSIRNVDPGFVPEGALAVALLPEFQTYAEPEARARIFQNIVDRLGEIPGVSAVGGINRLPLTGRGPFAFRRFADFPIPDGESAPSFNIRRVTPGYFEAMGMPIVEGRDFTSQDHEQRLGTVIIANNIKRSFWPRESAIGKRIRAGADRWATVVGVVGDVRGGGLDQEPRAVMYYPMLDSVGGNVGPLRMVVRSESGMEDLVPRIRSAVQEIDANLPLNSVRTLDDLVASSISRITFTLYLVTLGGIVSLLLGAVGIYGVVSYAVNRRRREMGVRLALGAEPSGLRWLVVGEGLRLALAGVAVGIVLVYPMGRILESMLYGVQATDPTAMAGGALLFLLVGVLASLIPATRATRTSVVEVLKPE